MSRPLRAPFTILVIDDDPQIRETAAELLELDGHRVLAAASADHGLAMALTVRPDLIFVDYHLPGMNGLEVVQRLKAGAATKRIPVVALTSGTAEAANELSRAGCVAFISKPFEPTEFLRLVADILKETVGRNQQGDIRIDPERTRQGSGGCC